MRDREGIERTTFPFFPLPTLLPTLHSAPPIPPGPCSPCPRPRRPSVPKSPHESKSPHGSTIAAAALFVLLSACLYKLLSVSLFLFIVGADDEFRPAGKPEKFVGPGGEFIDYY